MSFADCHNGTDDSGLRCACQHHAKRLYSFLPLHNAEKGIAARLWHPAATPSSRQTNVCLLCFCALLSHSFLFALQGNGKIGFLACRVDTLYVEHGVFAR